MYSYGPPHMAGQKQDGQHEHTFSSYVRIQDVDLKTYQRRWTIGRSAERGSGISVLVARQDDDDFTPTLVSRCNALPKKVPKMNFTKEKTEPIRDEDVSFILSFIYWVQQPFLGWGSFSWIHWNGWIPNLRCQKYVNRFHVCMCPHLVFRASIRVSFLLEVCQSPVRVSL